MNAVCSGRVSTHVALFVVLYTSAAAQTTPHSNLPPIPPALLGQPGVPPNQSGGIGLYGRVPGPYDTQPGVNVLSPPQSVVSTSIPISFVNTNTGNHVLEYRDHIYPGDGLRFSFVRYYNSMDPYSGPLGRGWTHSYNVFLRINQANEVIYKQADGREVLFRPIGGGAYVAVTKGVFDTLTRNANGYVIVTADRIRLTFGTDGKLRSIAAESGETLTFDYDTAGNLTKITDPAARVFTLSYAGRLLISVSDSTAVLARYRYTNGFLTAYVDVLGRRTHYVYNGGQLKSARQPNGVTTFSNTFNAGQVSQQLNAEGKPTQFAYRPGASGGTSSCAGNTVTYITDPLSRITAHYFDSELRLICVVDALKGVTKFTYDAGNNRASITDPNGNTSRFEYDARGNLITRINAVNNITRYTYDSANHLLTTTDPRGNTTSYVYDARGNLVREIDALGNTTHYQYDASNNRISATDANGNTTRYSYIAATRLLQTVTDPLGRITRYNYDARGNRTGVTNANGNFALYCYDQLNRLVTIIDPPGVGGAPTCGAAPYHSYAYDAVGNEIRFTNGNGQTTSTRYDSSNRPVRVAHSAGEVAEYAYDPVGNRVSMEESTGGTTTYTYDALNRMTSTARLPGGIVRYEYDPAGNRLRTVYPDLKVIQYDYDSANRLIRAGNSSSVKEYLYDAAGNVLQIDTSSNVSIGFSYDNANRLVGVRNSFRSGSDPDSIPLTSFRYTLDGVGNRTSVTDGAGQLITYTYDALNQLRSASEGSQVETWTYDPAGNRITATSGSSSASATYTPENILTTFGSVLYEHDREGNRIRAKSSSGAVISEYTWNAAGRLIKVVGPFGTTTFSYDGDGNRTRKVVNGVVTDYVNDVAAPLVVVLQEITAGVRTSYVWGRSLLSAENPAFHHQYLFDGLSSVVGVTGPDGVRRQRYKYDAWGQVRAVIPPTGTGNANPFRFTGEAQEPGSDLLYLRTRYYDPATGRFLSPDRYFSYPLLPITLNKFVYVRNNPVRYFDRTGRDAWPDSTDDTGDGATWPFSPGWP
jgi:RHS repeat-associated protein